MSLVLATIFPPDVYGTPVEDGTRWLRRVAGIKPHILLSRSLDRTARTSEARDTDRGLGSGVAHFHIRRRGLFQYGAPAVESRPVEWLELGVT